MGKTPAQAPAGASPSDAPLAFIAKQRGAFRLHALDEEALALGLEPGMALADARARAPGLQAVPHDPDAEHRALERLADLADRFTPMVTPQPPDGLVLDITGCTHLFGGERALVRDAMALMRGQGLRVRTARAMTPEAALALARLGTRPPSPDKTEASAIRRLPLLALRAEAGALAAMRRAGFICIGDLADLPRAPLVARFGADMVAMLDRLLGRADSRITPRRLPAPIRAERRFAEPMARVDSILGVIGDLLEEACTRLTERHEGGRRFAVRLYRSDGAMRDLAVETGQPLRAPEPVVRLFAERIESLADPIDPGFGFDIIRLAVPVTQALGMAQDALDGAQARPDDLAALLDRLAVRMGVERFRRLVPQETHLPERAMRLVPVMATAAQPAMDWDTPLADEPPLRPLLLLDPPERIRVIAQVPDGPPRHFQWRDQAHRIIRQEGPERIAPEWWRRAEGHDADPGLTRDYYRVEDMAGRRFWLFRRGLYERESNDPHWYVHGLFA